MSFLISRVYQCTDGQTFSRYIDAWEYEHRTRFPDIKMFNEEGKLVTDIRKAHNFIVDTQEEAFLINDYMVNQRDGTVLITVRCTPHSWITPIPYDCDYILYNSEECRYFVSNECDEIYKYVKKNSDLWRELMGR